MQAYYVNPAGAWASCTRLVVDPVSGVSVERGHIVSRGSLDDLQPFELSFEDFYWSGNRPITASYLVGRGGAGVARVKIRSPGQPPVVASSANGWWAAWLPGPIPAPWQIVALDQVGGVVDTIDGVSQDIPG